MAPSDSSERFWAKVKKDGPIPERAPHLGQCWLWTGSFRRKGNNILDSVAPQKDTGAPIAPWVSSPYQLWSLWDVQRFSTDALVKAMTLIEKHRIQLLSRSPLRRRKDDPEVRESLKRQILTVRQALQGTALSQSFESQITRLINRLDLSTAESDAERLAQAVIEFEYRLWDELREPIFFAVPSARSHFYLDAHDWFGVDTVRAFRDTRRDMRDACQCFAFGQWTAVVFHSMRILEHGLWWLADELNVEKPEFKDWGTLINQIENQIKLVKSEPKGPNKNNRLKFYSQAAVEFGYFKDAWRNHAAHSRESYDEQAAERVLTHVQNFMAILANEIKARKAS